VHTGSGRHVAKNGPAKRPSSIAELAEMAMLNLWDDSKDFKHYLRMAEKYRKEGKECAKKGDLEGAFVQLARAATLVLEKLPVHRDYNGILTANQRQNLSLVRIYLSSSNLPLHLKSLCPSTYPIVPHFCNLTKSTSIIYFIIEWARHPRQPE